MNPMELLRVTLNGCDDSTSVEIEVTPSERVMLHALAQKLKAAATYGCMPTMQVESGEGEKSDDRTGEV